MSIEDPFRAPQHEVSTTLGHHLHQTGGELALTIIRDYRA